MLFGKSIFEALRIGDLTMLQKRGYAFVIATIGVPVIEGAMVGDVSHEGEDGHDVIEWMAKQLVYR